MRTRTLLIGSLAVNVLVVALWLTARRQPPPSTAVQQEITPATPTGPRTNIVVRRQFFTWSELESDDYSKYIENLRSVNCPEQTIRDIIVADVNELFSQRQSTEVLPRSRQWWQSKPDPGLVQLAERQRAVLERERRALLETLLGPDWETSSAPTVAIKVPLDGPILGSLTQEEQEAIQAASGRAQQYFERILKADPSSPDPAALAAMERQLTAEVRPLLSPAQLEEFLLRYSPSAQRLRLEFGNLPLFDATPMETRTAFRNVHEIELKLMSLVGEGASVDSQREALNRERQIGLQNALGPARYKVYERLQDPAYQRAIAAAQAAGITTATDLFYAIEQLGAQEQALINQDTGLTPLQRELALRRLELEQLQAAAQALGQSSPAEPPPPPPRTYSFQKGDTIADVSMRTGVPVALLLRANPSLRPEQIAIGTQIIIPDRTAPLE